MHSAPPRPARPRFITPRDDRFPTFGPQVGTVAGALGTPLMPWQTETADVMGEVDPSGRYRYPLVVISVPRQAGKTTLVLANGVHRCLARPKRKVWHTAQTGQDARTKWLEMAEAFAGSPLAPLATIKRGAGDSKLVFVNGSQLRPHPPTIDALHGEQSDLNDIDEGWSFTEAEGANLMQAIVPTQATRPGAQTIILSTMGTSESVWFHDLVDRGRAGEPGICYVEYSIADDVDPTDLEAVAAAHPAYGYTIDMQALERAAAQLPPGEFARAYGNRRTGAAERVIALSDWEDHQTTTAIPDSARPAFGAAVAFDRSETAIAAAAWANVNGALVPVAELIECRPGTGWGAARCAELVGRHQNAGLLVDRGGPSSTLADALELAGVELLPCNLRDVTTACANLLDSLEGRRDPVFIRPHPALSTAAGIATKRSVGDGWAWSRSGSVGSIAALEAVTLAFRALEHQPVAPAAPMIWTA